MTIYLVQYLLFFVIIDYKAQGTVLGSKANIDKSNGANDVVQLI